MSKEMKCYLCGKDLQESEVKKLGNYNIKLTCPTCHEKHGLVTKKAVLVDLSFTFRILMDTKRDSLFYFDALQEDNDFFRIFTEKVKSKIRERLGRISLEDIIEIENDLEMPFGSHEEDFKEFGIHPFQFPS